MERSRNDPPAPTSTLAELIAGEHLLILAFLFFVIFGVFLTYLYFGRTLDNPLSFVPTSVPLAVVAADGSQPQSSVIQRHTNSTGPTLVGIISGHKDNDSGAVCADGTTEAATNLRISEQVIALLQAQGIEAELLSENDPRLTPNYPAVAVISIHADSCQDAGATLSGYKTAVSQAVTSPLLQQCIEPIYGEQTGLKYNVNTITNDMTNYHAFSADQLSTVVPAIIIETGFLGGDKALLVDHSEIPAQAITDGILCFVEQLP